MSNQTQKTTISAFEQSDFLFLASLVLFARFIPTAIASVRTLIEKEVKPDDGNDLGNLGADA